MVDLLGNAVFSWKGKRARRYKNLLMGMGLLYNRFKHFIQVVLKTHLSCTAPFSHLTGAF